jgi:transcription elongation factor Elf1
LPREVLRRLPQRRGEGPTFWYAKISIMEHSFACPHCGEEISMVLDLSVRKQTYVEDCEVCCKPIEISYSVSDDELAEFSARTLG